MKEKRCLISIETKEAKALKAMREFRGVSVRSLSEKLRMSHNIKSFAFLNSKSN